MSSVPSAMTDLLIAFVQRAPLPVLENRTELNQYLVQLLVSEAALHRHHEFVARASQQRAPHDELYQEIPWNQLLDVGPDALSDDQLGSLLLNPTTLTILNHEVFETLPASLLPAIEAEGRRIREELGLDYPSFDFAANAAKPEVVTRSGNSTRPTPAGNPIAEGEWNQRTFSPSDFSCSTAMPSQLVKGAATFAWRWEVAASALEFEVGTWLAPGESGLLRIALQRMDGTEKSVGFVGPPVDLSLPLETPPLRGETLRLSLTNAGNHCLEINIRL